MNVLWLRHKEKEKTLKRVQQQLFEGIEPVYRDRTFQCAEQVCQKKAAKNKIIWKNRQ